MEELEAWVQPKTEAWSQGVRNLDKTAKRYPQLAHAGLGMSLQLEWHYMQMTVLGAGSLMGLIEYALGEAFFPAIFRGEQVSA